MKDFSGQYDSWHQTHPTGSGPWYQLVWSALERGELLRGARILEIGCGGGEFSWRMAKAGAVEVVGQDFATVAIDGARERFNQSNLRFEVGDIQAIGYPDEHFDVVVSCETLEHVPDPQTAVSELARVLRSSGTLLLTTPNYLSLTGLHRLYRAATGRKWDEDAQPLVHWTLLPRTLWWLRASGMIAQLVSGDGWYIPIPRRPGGYALHPSGWRRFLATPYAVHQLIEARHRKPSRSPR